MVHSLCSFPSKCSEGHFNLLLARDLAARHLAERLVDCGQLLSRPVIHAGAPRLYIADIFCEFLLVLFRPGFCSLKNFLELFFYMQKYTMAAYSTRLTPIGPVLVKFMFRRGKGSILVWGDRIILKQVCLNGSQ